MCLLKNLCKVVCFTTESVYNRPFNNINNTYMNEVASFLIEHLLLSCVLFVALATYLVFEYMQSSNEGAISPEQTVDLINHQHAVVIDVRTPVEFATGHILDAHNFPSTESDEKIKGFNRYKHKPIVLVCARGKRSTQCLRRFQTHGFDQVFSLEGGIQAWKDAGLPLIQ